MPKGDQAGAEQGDQAGTEQGGEAGAERGGEAGARKARAHSSNDLVLVAGTQRHRTCCMWWG